MAIRTIVVGTNLAESGEEALLLARLTARSTGAALWLVHAIEDEQSRPKCRQPLERLRRSCEGAGVTTQTSCEHGTPWDVILRAAVSVDGDLIAVGNPVGSVGLLGRSLGSTAERLVHQAPCSVVVSCGRLRDDYAGARIVVGIDFSPHSIEAARWSRDVAAGIEGDVALVHIASEPTIGGLDSGARRRLEELVVSEGLEPNTTVRALQGPIGETLCQAVEELEAQLLFVGSRGQERTRGTTFGSTAQHCLRHSPVPMLAVRPRA
ncbi:MAG: universal stress protein [Myxococcales bacterium]|nr:universal stress protein [Myxococcales bacterium]